MKKLKYILLGGLFFLTLSQTFAVRDTESYVQDSSAWDKEYQQAS